MWLAENEFVTGLVEPITCDLVQDSNKIISKDQCVGVVGDTGLEPVTSAM